MKCKSTLEWLESLLPVSAEKLDDIVQQHSELCWHAGRLAADTRNEYERARQRLTEARADAYQRIRSEATEAGQRVTEAMLTSLVDTDPVVQQCVAQMQQAKHASDLAAAMREAYMQRGYLIKVLAELVITGVTGSDAIRPATR